MVYTNIDLHMHTHFSPDSSTTPEELIRAAEHAGLDVIGVTDHNSIEGGLAAQSIESSCLVIPGQEVKTRQGEVLVYGLDYCLNPARPLQETCQEAKEAGGFIIVPHPFDGMRHGIKEHILSILPLIDCVEHYNSHAKFSYTNHRAREFSQAHNLPVVASTDAHAAKELGSTITILETPAPLSTTADVYRALRTAPRTFITSQGTFLSFIKRKIRL